MKKRSIFIMLMLIFTCGFFLTACNSTPSVSGKFNNQLYIVSLNDTINFYDELASLKGAEKSAITFEVSNAQILEDKGNGEFTSINSGSTIVFAKYKDMVFAQTNVMVKYQFSSPTNISIQDDGTLTWDYSFAFVNDTLVYAQKYLIEYANITNLTEINEDNLVFESIEVIDNFKFTNEGSYYVRITALKEDENYIDSSLVAKQIVNYKAMGMVENITLSVSTTFGDNNATLSWQEKENAVYTIFLDGFKVQDNLEENLFTYDYSNVSNNQSVEVKIICQDINGQNIPSVTNIILSKLESPKYNYNYKDANDNTSYIYFENIENAENYLAYIENTYNGQIYLKNISREEVSKLYFDDLASGIYNIKFVSVGGTGNNGYYLNSEQSSSFNFAKLATPEVDVTFENENALFNFTSDIYNNRYLISYSDKYTIVEGNSARIDISDLEKGEYTFNVIALPKLNGETVVPFEQNGLNTDIIISSSAYTFDFVILDDILTFTHELNLPQNISTFTINKISGANYYELYINGELVSDTIINEGQNYVNIQVENLSQYLPINNEYNVEVVAGVRENGIEKAVLSTATKTLTILDEVTQSTEQTNGYFTWNLLDNSYAYYEYEIYKTESDYYVSDNQTPVQSGGTTENIINERLDFGYYVIRIKTISINYNNFLDSDFYNEGSYYEGHFIVNQQIETPTVVFVKDNGEYKLLIDSIDYAGGFDIYIDSELYRSITFSQSSGQAVCEFGQDMFDEARTYNIEVVANSGQNYDGTLHTNSQPFELTVTKLARPEFNVVEAQDIAGRKTAENLVVNLIENTSHAVIKIDGMVVNDENNSNIFNLINQDNEFVVSLTYIAGENKGNNYYLDSDEYSINFYRVNAPQNISFNDGYLSWTNDDENVKDYYLSITLLNETNGDAYYRIKIEGNKTNLDLQSIIDQLCEEQGTFESNYLQCDGVMIELNAYNNAFIGEDYYLPSINGTALGGGNSLVLTTLDAPVVTFDAETLDISWNHVAENTSYDVYIGNKVITDFTSNKINLSQITDVNFSSQQNVYVISNNPKYLSSENSNIIYIKQLAPIDSVNISSGENGYSMAFSLSGDLNNIKEVQVNGSSANVNYTTGSNWGSLSFSDFAQTQTFELKVIALNNSDTYYYYNSSVNQFEFYNLANMDFNVSLSENKIIWDNIAEDFIGQIAGGINPIIYSINVVCGGQTYTISSLTQNEYLLQDLENVIGISLTGNIEISVKAEVLNYTLSLLNGQGKGYYGQITTEFINTQKLSTIENVSYQILDGTGQGAIEAKQNAYAQLTWQNVWEDLDVTFSVEVSSDNQKVTFEVKNGTKHENYNLERQDTIYVLNIYSPLLSGNINNITLSVSYLNYINSEQTSVSISRLANIEDITLNQDGIITINDSRSDISFIVGLTIGNVSTSRTYSVNPAGITEIDLMVDGLLQDNFGSYEIQVLAFDSNGKMLCSNLTTFIGTKLQGISSYEIKDDGYLHINLYLDDFDGMNFILRTKVNGEYVYAIATRDDESSTSNSFKIYLHDLIDIFSSSLPMTEGLYSFEITVYKEGSIRADYITVEFYYSIDNTPTLIKGQDLTKEYFVFDIPENDDIVTINAKIYAYDISSQNFIFTDSVLSFARDVVKGYWCIDESTNDQYFSLTIDEQNTDISYTECYAISANDILKDYSYGAFYVELTRLGKNNNIYNVYSKQSKELFKLNRVNDEVEEGGESVVRIYANYLYWEWEPASEYAYLSLYKPTAYYVIIKSAEEGDDESFKLLTYSSSYDLRSAELTPGKNYLIYVIAASSKSQVLASDQSTTYVSAIKYTTPTALDVSDGMITFDKNAFKNSEFLSVIQNYFASATHEDGYLYDLMGNTNYTSPLYFYSSELYDAALTLRFTAKDNTGADTNTYYEISLKGYMLFPDIEIQNNDYNITTTGNISYFDLLEAYTNTIEGVSSSQAVNFKTMVQTLLQSNRGFAGNGVLFDDFGKQIPAGDYSLSVYQKGLNNKYIDSEMSSATSIYITSSPTLSLSRETGSSGENNYMATFGTTQTYIDENGDGTSYIKQTTRQYYMLLRYDYSLNNNLLSYSGSLGFTIIYLEGSGWQIYFSNTKLEGVISDVENGGDIPGFKINVTNLRTAYDSLVANDTLSIRANSLIRVDVFALSGADGYVINGKSANFNLRYLDLPTDDISFSNGKMIIRTNLDSTSVLLMRYLTQGSEVSQTLIQMYNGLATINLPREGSYNYIVLSLNGSISYNTINVESKTYAIEGLYKLYSPSMSTQNNNLYVTYNANDINYTQDQSIHFYLTNNQSSGYYYSSILHRENSGNLTYQVGSKNPDTNEVYYPSELEASEFSVYLLGNSGYLVATESDGETIHGADYVWTFMSLNSSGSYENSIMLFSSENAIINAKMLNIVDSVYISDGDINWTVSDDLPSIQDGSILYQVTINYYKKVIGENEASVTYEFMDSDIYYTTNQMLKADYISQDYEYYSIDVTPLAGKLLANASSDPRALPATTEGEYYLIYDSVYYEDGTQVLRGLTKYLGTKTEPISRTSTPILTPSDSIINSGISNGNIVFYISTEDYGGDISDENNANAASRIIIKANYSQGGKENSVEINGEYAFSTSSLSGAGGYVMVTFTPYEEQLNNISPFNITIQMYTNDSLLSKSLTISNVYKMSAINENYYQTRLENGQTILDFSNYFKYVSIASDNSCYKVVLNYTTTDGRELSTIFTSTTTLKTFVVSNNIKKIVLQVQDNQDTSTVNRLLLLYSDTLEFIVEETKVQNDNNENLLEINWDSENLMFVWNWLDETLSTDYEYYYEIKISGTELIRGTTKENYYMPNDRGTIENFLIKARKIVDNASQESEKILYIYSTSISYISQTPIIIDIFSGGNGTSNNPYLIANEEDFYNISKRNISGQVFYFRFTNNIEIDFSKMVEIVENDNGQEQKFLMKEFYGNLNGNGYTLTYIANNLYQIEDGYTADDIIGLNSVTFNNYFALFKTISSGATISNIIIDMEIDINSINNTNAIISSIALYNYGTVSGIIVNNMSLTHLTGQGYTNYIFMSGLVGVNYGMIENSTNNADITYSTPQRVPFYFGYAGIALFNDTDEAYIGRIVNSFNTGDISLTARTNNINLYGSGIVISNGGILNCVGNDGNFTINTTSAASSCSAYFTGIALYSNGFFNNENSISYAYNNGQFTNSSTSARLVKAGIVYSLASGQINTLVDTKGNTLVSTNNGNIVDNGTNYATIGSGTTAINFIELKVVSIDCGNGYYLKIQSSGGNYIASIGR